MKRPRLDSNQGPRPPKGSNSRIYRIWRQSFQFSGDAASFYVTTPGTLPRGPGVVKDFLGELTRVVIHAPHPFEAATGLPRRPRPPASSRSPRNDIAKVPLLGGRVKWNEAWHGAERYG